MADQIEIVIPRPTLNEGTGFTALAYFRTRSTSSASIPTTAKYRIDCLSTETALLDWTTLTPASSISIPIAGQYNAIQSSGDEVKQLTVMANEGLSTQVLQDVRWTVEDLYGSP
jgi:hypothetical protein